MIDEEYVTYKGSPWHPDCFTCANCNKVLSGEFNPRDEKLYCTDCFGELFAKKCVKCTKPLTGESRTKEDASIVLNVKIRVY